MCNVSGPQVAPGGPVGATQSESIDSRSLSKCAETIVPPLAGALLFVDRAFRARGLPADRPVQLGEPRLYECLVQ